MSMQMTTENHPDYLKVKITGQWNINDVLRHITAIKEAADLAGTRRILADMRDLAGNPSTMDRFYAGAEVAKVMLGYWLAVLAQEEIITSFGQMVAVNRGAWMIVRSSETEAIEWLHGRIQTADLQQV